MTARRVPHWRSRLLVAVMIWLFLAGWGLWIHRRPPIAHLVLAPSRSWQAQVWFGARTTISHQLDQQAVPSVPIIMVFYRSPFTGTRLLVRTALPAWPLMVSAVTLAIIAMLLIREPVVTRWRARRHGQYRGPDENVPG